MSISRTVPRVGVVTRGWRASNGAEAIFEVRVKSSRMRSSPLPEIAVFEHYPLLIAEGKMVATNMLKKRSTTFLYKVVRVGWRVVWQIWGSTIVRCSKEWKSGLFDSLLHTKSLGSNSDVRRVEWRREKSSSPRKMRCGWMWARLSNKIDPLNSGWRNQGYGNHPKRATNRSDQNSCFCVSQ